MSTASGGMIKTTERPDVTFIRDDFNCQTLVSKTDIGKTYVVHSPMFRRKTSSLERNDFDVSPLDMEEGDTVPVRKTDIGESCTAQSPAVERIELDTSLLSLVGDDQVPESDNLDGFDTAANFRSPARKKRNEEVASPSVRTPQKTPKRKVAQNNFIWPTDVLDMFLKECIKRKTEVSKDHVPLVVWKDISAVLQACGHQYPWDLCRAKFESMLNFFWKSLVPAGGIVCGVKCNYYDQFCLIFDVAKQASNVDKGRIWDDKKRTQLLLSLYEDRREEFDSSSNRHDALYAQIAAEMSHFDIYVNGAQCRARLNDLKQEFRAEYDRTRRTGSAPSTWPFFDQMFGMFEGSVTLEAPVSLSVGTTSQHLLKGAAAEQSLETGSRTSPVVAQPKSARNRASQQKQKVRVQQQQMECTNAIANELRLTRETMERRSEERWKDLLNALLNKTDSHGVANSAKNLTK